MASLGIVISVLGFDEAGTALLITIFALQDSFGTACNVTGDGAHDEHHHDDAGHADMGAMYTYTCATPAKLTGLEATLFSLYPSLEKLSVQGILPTGQTAAELTPSANKLGW